MGKINEHVLPPKYNVVYAASNNLSHRTSESQYLQLTMHHSKYIHDPLLPIGTPLEPVCKVQSLDDTLR